MLKPEQEARQLIDQQLAAAGWLVQANDAMNIYAGPGVAVCEFRTETGPADYVLFVNGQALGVVEAKKMGTTLSGIAEQSADYAASLRPEVPHVAGDALPFLYQSTGIETTFRDDRDPQPRSRRVFAFHRPETLAAWAAEPQSLRARLADMPPLQPGNMWAAQVEAVTNLEKSLAENRPRALIQMATGSGKTYTTVNFVYRLIKHAKARRVLFLVDRNNLGKQAFKEFDLFETPDDGRKFTELYNIQHLKSNVTDDVGKVHITTIQRLFSMLKGDQEYDQANEDEGLMAYEQALADQTPHEVAYNPTFPIEYYDFIVVDECHRSIYNLWRQVLEYFDAFLIGLTATPNNLTYGFFQGNLVQEYTRQRAVADGVNVDGQVYRIQTAITQGGSHIDAGIQVVVRDRQTRQERWQLLDEELDYEARQLDREVVSTDQITTVIRTFRDKLFTEIFPGRSEVPKTLVFAKDDNHAEEIVNIIRREFGKGDDFCKKITYRVSGVTPEQLIQDFRNSYNPRIAVTVDMIATGTDIRPLEILLFMRNVKSAGLFEQMIGRGTRTISDTDFHSVTPGKQSKTHFVIVDAVGVVDQEKFDPKTLERSLDKTFKQLIDLTKYGTADEATLSSLVSRLSRMNKQLTEAQHARIEQASGGASLPTLMNGILDALDLDAIREHAAAHGQSFEQAEQALVQTALRPFAANPGLRDTLVDIRRIQEQTIDDVSQDRVLAAGYSPQDTQRAQQTVASFRQYLEAHRDEFTALQIIFSQPYSRRQLTYAEVKTLADALAQPPNSWTTEALWRAYHQLEHDRVRDVNGQRVLTDLVSLVRHTLDLDEDLAPYPDRVRRRYAGWLAAQQAAGRSFTPQQRWWLDKIAQYIGVNLTISLADLNVGDFTQRGGQVAARQVFGAELEPLLAEINLALSAQLNK